jgi:hypothetical protein
VSWRVDAPEAGTSQFQVATLPLHAALVPVVTLPESTLPYSQQ